MRTLLFIFGTRPEAIKLAPLVHAFQAEPDFRVRVCVTAQHREMLDQVLGVFRIRPDHDLNLMLPGQDLNALLARAIQQLDAVFQTEQPAMAFVQGDTTTTLAGGLAAFHRRVPTAHIEAGLRSGDMASPFPEEMNRVLATRVASLHFAPTPRAAANLAAEGVTRNVHVVGNTGIDALHLALAQMPDTRPRSLSTVDMDRPIVLITCHRRESFGAPFREICSAIAELARSHPDTQFVYPVHLNPAIHDVAQSLLSAPNIRLLQPLSYPNLVLLMNRCRIVLTDSGGIQEEAPSLGKPVLVMRDVTERTEGIDGGTAILVGTSRAAIMREASRILTDDTAYQAMATRKNPYGDGAACQRIVTIVRSFFDEQA